MVAAGAEEELIGEANIAAHGANHVCISHHERERERERANRELGNMFDVLIKPIKIYKFGCCDMCVNLFIVY